MLKHCRPDILARGHLSLLHRRSPTNYWLSHTTLTCSVSTQYICSGYSPLSYSCTARGVVQIVAMKQGIVSSPLEADHWKIYHLPKLHWSSMWSEHCYMRVSTGVRPPPSNRKFQTSVNWAGTRTSIYLHNSEKSGNFSRFLRLWWWLCGCWGLNYELDCCYLHCSFNKLHHSFRKWGSATMLNMSC